MPDETSDVAVVGGGIAGLSAAHALAKRGVGFVVLEAEGRWGGVVRTDREGGFLLEGGPDALLAVKPEAIALCRELGLGDRLVPTNPVERAVFVLRRGRLVPLPEGMALAVPTRIAPFLASPLFSWPGKLRMGLDLLIPPRRDGADESIAGFVRRRLGEEALEIVGDALMAGIHSGDPERLSIRATFPRFVEMEARHGSLIRAMWAARPRGPAGTAPPGFYSLAGGLGELVDALVARLPAASLRAGCPVESIARDGAAYVLRTAAGAVRARAVVCAAPAPKAAAILRELAPEVAARLAAIPFVSTASVLLGYRREDVAHPLDGYGLVVPRGEGLRTAAVSFSSTKFPGRAPTGHVLLRAFLGGARDPDVLSLDDSSMARLVEKEMGPALGLRGAPGLARVYRWPQGTPQMEVGQLARMEEIDRLLAALPGLALAGAGLRGTGIPDCVADGTKAAEKAVQTAHGSPARPAVD